MPMDSNEAVLSCFSRFSAKKAAEAILVFGVGGIEPAPLALTGVQPDRRVKSMNDRHEIAQRVIPGAPLVAIEGLIVYCVNFMT